MVHGDDSGLVLPPKVAPIQAVIIPIAQHKEGVLEKANEIKNMISSVVRIKLDDSDKMPGWKFNEYEMKGIPVRIEIGPKDIENNQVVLVRRDTREKEVVNLEDLKDRLVAVLDEIQNSLYQKALNNKEERTFIAKTMDELKDNAENKSGFTKAMWCGERECEDKIKEVAGLTSRCIPFDQENIDSKCVCCGKKAEKMVYWGKAY